MVCYSRKYNEIQFTLAHKRYCDRNNLNPDTVDLDELNKAMHEESLVKWKASSKAYYRNNSEKVKEAMRKNRAEKHEEILEKKREYAMTPFKCECGCEVRRNNLAKHLKTDKHVRHLQNLL